MIQAIILRRDNNLFADDSSCAQHLFQEVIDAENLMGERGPHFLSGNNGLLILRKDK